MIPPTMDRSSARPVPPPARPGVCNSQLDGKPLELRSSRASPVEPLGGAWVTYSYRDIRITADEALNPIVRYTGAIVLLAAVTTPLLLGSVWRSGQEPRP